MSNFGKCSMYACIFWDVFCTPGVNKWLFLLYWTIGYKPIKYHLTSLRVKFGHLSADLKLSFLAIIYSKTNWIWGLFLGHCNKTQSSVITQNN